MTERSQRRRIVRHHVPILLVSLVVLAAWMTVPVFQSSGHQGGPPTAAGQAEHSSPRGNEHAAATAAPAHQRPQQHGGSAVAPATRTSPAPADRETRDPIMTDRAGLARLTTATGYVASGLLALTLLIGPMKLMVRRRNPVSSYLRRDVGMWTAVFSVVHVVVGLQVHGPPGPAADRILRYFVTADGRPLTDAFGLGNWTGLAATAIVLALLAISSDVALRGLKAGPWKWIQRLNYVLFGLVIAHAVYYGALERPASIATLILVLIVASVLLGQIAGIALWRRRSRSERGRAAAA